MCEAFAHDFDSFVTLHTKTLKMSPYLNEYKNLERIFLVYQGE